MPINSFLCFSIGKYGEIAVRQKDGIKVLNTFERE